MLRKRGTKGENKNSTVVGWGVGLGMFFLKKGTVDGGDSGDHGCIIYWAHHSHQETRQLGFCPKWWSLVREVSIENALNRVRNYSA